MKTFSAFLVILTLCSTVLAGTFSSETPVKVGVLDTGFGYNNLGHGARLCKYGHKDLTKDQKFYFDYDTVTPVPIDFNSHGTNIEGIIENYAGKANYCIVVIKFYSQQQTGQENSDSAISAIEYATNIKIDFINFSGGGAIPSGKEYAAVESFLNQGGKLIAAAGNENTDLDIPESGYYPAMYDSRVISVGNNRANGSKAFTSNYGKRVSVWEVGESIEAYGITMSGTSQATAKHTGKLISQTNKNKCDIGDYDKH